MTTADQRDLDAYRLLIADVYELAGLSRRISEREAVAEGSSVARWHILSVVSEEPASVPAIARRLGQVRQGVQRVVDELVDDGFLVRRSNPAHARSALVATSPKGDRLLALLTEASATRRLAALSEAGLDAACLYETRIHVRALIDALHCVE